MPRSHAMRLLPVVFTVALLAGCASPFQNITAAPEADHRAPDESAAMVAPGQAESYVLSATAEPPPPKTGGADIRPAGTALPESVTAPGATERKIIKDATMGIEVADVTLALSRIDGTAAQLGGYVLETKTEGTESGRERASIRFAVPVDKFELARQQVREAATKVLTDYASGVDVSEEYVDLQSEVANLEATQARVRELLARAETVEEALQVNSELTRIEGEIALRKGRLQYLAQRAAHSTIAVGLVGPELPPTPTPTVAPTATPTPLPPWEPGRIASESFGVLRVTLRGLATVAIRAAIVLLPLFLVVAIPVAVAWLAVRWWHRRGARP